MASTLKINTLTGVSTAGSIAVTGEGNSTTTNLQQGLVKVWFQYNHDAESTYDSFNVGTITDRATGNFIVNFTNNMGNDDYALAGAAGFGYSLSFEDNEGEKTSATASDLLHVVTAVTADAGGVDQTVCSGMIAGDLA